MHFRSRSSSSGSKDTKTIKLLMDGENSLFSSLVRADLNMFMFNVHVSHSLDRVGTFDMQPVGNKTIPRKHCKS